MEQFLYFKKAQGMSERTLIDYERSFSRFVKYYEEDNINFPILKQKLVEFFSSLSEKAPATYNIPYSNLHAIFNWAVDQRYIKENPIKSLGLKKHKDEGKTRHLEEPIKIKVIQNLY